MAKPDNLPVFPGFEPLESDEQMTEDVRLVGISGGYEIAPGFCNPAERNAIGKDERWLGFSYDYVALKSLRLNKSFYPYRPSRECWCADYLLGKKEGWRPLFNTEKIQEDDRWITVHGTSERPGSSVGQVIEEYVKARAYMSKESMKAWGAWPFRKIGSEASRPSRYIPHPFHSRALPLP